jgi:DNA topoisomerase-6 subunit B
MVEVSAEEIFKEFKEQSIAEFFKKNRQMLGYSGMVRSLVTIVHEYVTNSFDACEEAGILPDIHVQISQTGENRYKISVADNGPGIPKEFIGKALGTILAGTKFHRYIQQRGQQGIGAGGCTLFAQITTGKPISVVSFTAAKNKKPYSCSISIDTAKNKPVITDYTELQDAPRGLSVTGEFAEIKYENSDHGVYEYLRRTALSNPHAQITFVGPDGKENVFMRATEVIPQRPTPTKPHPLGLTANDIIDFARISKSRKVSSFLSDTFSRLSQARSEELARIVTDVDFEKPPASITWDDAHKLVAAFKGVKWIAPDSSPISAIGKEQIEKAIKNILNPEFINIVERKPQVFRGGIPFLVEAAVAFGGNAGRQIEEGYEGNILRFANRVPLLFDNGNCAITKAVNGIAWKRYNIDMEAHPVSVFVNVSSIHIPYSGVGKESISQEDEIVEEIKLAVMDAARGVKRYISGQRSMSNEISKYKTVMRYAKQLAKDLSSLTGIEENKIEQDLEKLTIKHYPKAGIDSDERDIEDSMDNSAAIQKDFTDTGEGE